MKGWLGPFLCLSDSLSLLTCSRPWGLASMEPITGPNSPDCWLGLANGSPGMARETGQALISQAPSLQGHLVPQDVCTKDHRSPGNILWDIAPVTSGFRFPLPPLTRHSPRRGSAWARP